MLGTRPEVIKMAPVIAQLKKQPHAFDVSVIATAQHRELLDQALSIFELVPDLDLDLMSPGQSLATLSTRVMEHMDAALGRIQPEMILVQGDTTTVFITALAAFYRSIPLTHIEAGLRSDDLTNPFPEEANRRLTTVLAEINCAPTTLARTRLLHEGVLPEKIIVTGNTVVDALHIIRNKPFSFAGSPIDNIPLDGFRTILVTCHRRESWEKDLEQIFLALADIAKLFPDVRIIYPVHLNPEVRSRAWKILGNVERIHLLPPLDYVTFVNVMKRSQLILTDSGGMQEEAPTLCKPLFVLRRTTERPEACQEGLSRLIGTTREGIVRETSAFLRTTGPHSAAFCTASPYGDGAAAERIVEALERWSQGIRPLLAPEREFRYEGEEHAA